MYGPSNDVDDVLWSQERNVQKFTVQTQSDGQVTPGYLFELTQMENYHYMLQLGLDVFVFNAGIELFSKVTGENNRIDTILSDRSFKMKAKVNDAGELSSEYIASVMALHDDDELIIVDGGRIFKLDYLTDFTPPVNASEYTVRKPSLSRSHTNQLSDYNPFSQFDLTQCESYKVEDGDDIDIADIEAGLVDVENCGIAHDLLASTWQFITACDPALGCSAAESVDDNCITLAENLETPSPSLPSPDHQDICTPSDFTHLSELDQPDNNVQFRGFMQYDKKFIDELDFILDRNSLFITARMNKKDVLLRYFYQEDLTAPKSSRELVLFGDRIDHFALDAYIENNNLFVSTLLKASTRFNECYKNYQLVGCNDGSDNACTAEEIENESCATQYQEFSSHALFCSASQLSSRVCSDTQLTPNMDLSVEGSDHNGKWLVLYDETFDEGLGGTVDNREMFLLSGLQSDVTDEGVLLDPELLSIDNITGEINKVLGPIDSELVNDVVGTVSGNVESIIGGWIERNIDDELGFGHFQIIPEEVDQTGGVSSTSVSSVSQNFIVEDGTSTRVQNSAFISPLKSGSNGEPIEDIKHEPMLYFFDRPITKE